MVSALWEALLQIVAELLVHATGRTLGDVPGISLLVSPLVTGAVMDRYGHWRVSHGSTVPFSATFLGGACFALGMAGARFFFVVMV